MKRLICLLLCLACLPFAAAFAEDAPTAPRILIAYFSRAGENYAVGVITEGNTEKLAAEIARQTGGDLFRIETVREYPQDYKAMLDVATEEFKLKTHPELATAVENWQDYDVVFLGYPIWWGQMPMALHSFIESYEWAGKTVIPFNTHEGSGQSGTWAEIAALLPDSTVMTGLALRGKTAQNDAAATEKAVKDWLQALQLDKEEKQ